MANTVVSIFETKEAAEDAQQHLISSGYGGYQIELKIASYKSDAQFPVSEEEDHDMLDKITAFFKDLFGADHEDVGHYTQASRAGIILTVHTDTREEAEKVSEILDAYGVNLAEQQTNEGSLNPLHNLDHGDKYLPETDNTRTDRQYENRASKIKTRIVERNLERSWPSKND